MNEEREEEALLLASYAGKWTLGELLLKLGLAPSKAEARRLIMQDAVFINGNKQTDIDGKIPISNSMLLMIGKRRVKLRII